MNTYSIIFFSLIFLFLLECLNCKYLLVKISENTVDDFKNTNGWEKKSSNIGLFRKDSSYPETVPLKPEVMERCKNEKLISKKSFTVDRVDVKKKHGPKNRFDWEFTAALDTDVLSTLIAKNGGICNMVNTDEDSQGCGLATTLMQFCFTDDNVGGVDIQNNKVFNNEYLKQRREMAIDYCEHTVFLECLAHNVDTCSAYFTAAINTKHTIMFVQDDTLKHMYVLNVEKTRAEFKKGAKRWIDNHGDAWFFCQCKTEREAECGELP
jgi:hypothetical protein